ncbi:hypothetical protein F751_3067 [Auxenochlorella protothecoides]|uniref:Uncharacterized protein n=1 Tax=Auxenochlorella protothecoides TaxID=3075 RepID=A0A087SF45_AUXPR|nr:hypothetical protein F751_3067 [Auxenochlorella protothecoides]KFM24349.1 hypothetical protein F751_3067 [Auxenochlorella protothecoides]
MDPPIQHALPRITCPPRTYLQPGWMFWDQTGCLAHTLPGVQFQTCAFLINSTQPWSQHWRWREILSMCPMKGSHGC